MTVYMTKTWGFDSPSGPLQFRNKGARDRVRAELNLGDLVVIVGTLGDETAEAERGKILGLMEPTIEPAQSLDFGLRRQPTDFDEHGNYRWPFGLELRRAWRFTQPWAHFATYSERRFGMESAQSIVPLLPDEAEAILALPRGLRRWHSKSAGRSTSSNGNKRSIRRPCPRSAVCVTRSR